MLDKWREQGNIDKVQKLSENEKKFSQNKEENVNQSRHDKMIACNSMLK